MLTIYQGTPAGCDVEANLAQIAVIAGAARAAGSRILVVPELYVTGYNMGASLADLAEPEDGAIVSRLRQIAASEGLAIVAGFPERSGADVYNAAVLVDSSGVTRAIYRKAHLFGEREPKVFTPGNQFMLVDLAEARIGFGICYDIEFPEFVQTLAEAGAELIVVPTANMTPYWDVPTTLVRARALENGVGIAYANLSGVENDLSYTGLSAAVGPDGRDVARAGPDGPALLTVPLQSLVSREKASSTQRRDRRTARMTLPSPIPR